MFVLARLRLPVRLPPASWSRPLDTALVDALNTRLGNKILYQVGLVVSVWDILDIGDCFIFPGDGASHTKVTFRVVVFRPFLEEVLTGKIKSCTTKGVHVSLGFFDDILIPHEALQHPYRFDENEQVWVWEYPTDDGPHDMFMDPGEEIRFRVTSETFVDTSPTAPEPAKQTPQQQAVQQAAAAAGQQQPGVATGAADAMAEQEEKKIPYMIQASVNEPGLGLLSWWT